MELVHTTETFNNANLILDAEDFVLTGHEQDIAGIRDGEWLDFHGARVLRDTSTNDLTHEICTGFRFNYMGAVISGSIHPTISFTAYHNDDGELDSWDSYEHTVGRMITKKVWGA